MDNYNTKKTKELVPFGTMAEELSNAIKIARILGYTQKGEIRDFAIRLLKERYQVDFFLINRPIWKLGEQKDGFPPTELAKKTGLTSPRTVNRILEDMGLQTKRRNSNGQIFWTPTSYATERGFICPLSLNRPASNKPLLWQEEIVPLLKKAKRKGISQGYLPFSFFIDGGV